MSEREAAHHWIPRFDVPAPVQTAAEILDPLAADHELVVVKDDASEPVALVELIELVEHVRHRSMAKGRQPHPLAPGRWAGEEVLLAGTAAEAALPGAAPFGEQVDRRRLEVPELKIRPLAVVVVELPVFEGNFIEIGHVAPEHPRMGRRIGEQFRQRDLPLAADDEVDAPVILAEVGVHGEVDAARNDEHLRQNAFRPAAALEGEVDLRGVGRDAENVGSNFEQLAVRSRASPA